MKLTRTSLIILSIVCLLFIVIFPLIFWTCNDSFLTLISTSLTGLGAVATVITLFIAITLYKKFGIESRFLERQADKTLELVDYLKGKVITISNNKFHFLSRFNIDKYKDLDNYEFVKILNPKPIVFKVTDYENFLSKIIEIKKSYWIPNEVREKIEALEFYAYGEEISDLKDDIYAQVDFPNKTNGNYVIPIPNMTVKEFLKIKYDLVKTIEDWLDKHCDIKISLNLKEGNQKIEQQNTMASI